MTIVALFILAGLIITVVIFRERFRPVYDGKKQTSPGVPRNIYIGLSVLTLTLAVVETVAFLSEAEAKALVFALGAYATTAYFWWSAWRAA